MKIRAHIFEDDETIRTLLQHALSDRGYEVYCYARPDLCPMHMSSKCECPSNCACSDIIISDLRMPVVDGLEFVRNQREKGCKVRFVALMSASWTEIDVQMARLYDCEVFQKPFPLADLNRWLEDCEKQLDPSRQLFNLPPSPRSRWVGDSPAGG